MTGDAPAGPPYVGVDLLHIGELDRLTRRPWFLRLLYSPAERRTADGFGADRRREFLAGRFAAKEAVLKVLGTGLLAGIPAWQVDIARTVSGAPAVRLTGAAQQRAAELGLGQITLSLSHKDELVMAVAVGWPRQPVSVRQHTQQADPTARAERELQAAVARIVHAPDGLLTRRRTGGD